MINPGTKKERNAASGGTFEGIGAKQAAQPHEQGSLSQALEQSDENFRLLVENVQDYAIFLLDPQGRVASWNAGAERIKGYRAGEILGQPFSCFYPPEEVEQNKPEQHLTVAAREGSVQNEGWRVKKDGTRFFANAVLTALHDPQGTLRGFAKITRDITERSRPSRHMRPCTGRFPRCSKASATPSMPWTGSGASPTSTATPNNSGAAARRVPGQEPVGSLPWSVGSALHEAMLRAMRERQASQLEYWSPVLSAWLEVNLYPSGGGLAVYFRDISARKQAEQERYWLLRTAESRAAELAAALESIPDAVFLGNQGIITLANAPPLRCWGVIRSKT
jgi:PAS domain S-box-containing protein